MVSYFESQRIDSYVSASLTHNSILLYITIYRAIVQGLPYAFFRAVSQWFTSQSPVKSLPFNP